MKKYYSRVLMAMMAMMCVTAFTACGGDDGDDVPEVAPGTVAFVEPCLDFGTSREHVKEYMTGSSWQLMEESNEYVQMYSNSQNTITVNYSFIGTGKGLTMSTVTYITYNAQSIVAEVERRYKVTMKKDTDATQPGDTVYGGQATINGRTIAIMVHCTSATATVIYGIPD